MICADVGAGCTCMVVSGTACGSRTLFADESTGPDHILNNQEEPLCGTLFVGTTTSGCSWGITATTARSTPSVSDRSLICNADTGSGSSRSGTCVGTLGGFRVPALAGIAIPES